MNLSDFSELVQNEAALLAKEIVPFANWDDIDTNVKIAYCKKIVWAINRYGET